MDLETERQLVYKAQTDFSSFDRLYEYYFPKVFGFVKSKIYDDKRTEDLVSEIFVKVLDGLPKYEWKNVPFGAWIFMIARNHLKDHYAKSSRKPDPVDIEDVHVSDNKRESNPRHHAQMTEVQEAVLTELAKLPAREQEVLKLKFFAGMRNTEIAKTLKVSERNVAVILFRTLKKLKGPLSQLQ